jgi:hypothetical protein
MEGIVVVVEEDVTTGIVGVEDGRRRWDYMLRFEEGVVAAAAAAVVVVVVAVDLEVVNGLGV